MARHCWVGYGEPAGERKAPVAEIPRINDQEFVNAEYADDARLSARAAFWLACEGPQPQDVAFRRIVELAPTSVLEVGCGQGALAVALAEAGLEVTATDQSEQMVAITAARGIRALQADVRELPFDDGTFDLVLASYMLYHVPDLPRALSEIVRVLRPAGTLVAVTNSVHKLAEMWSLVGRDRTDAGHAEPFTRESGTEELRPFFGSIERVDIDKRFLVTEQAVRDYIRATRFADLVSRLPRLPKGLEVTAAGSVFIARV
jgi:ubiquinone/menaquinone biosynthesis C-methylase UbiE